MNIKVLVPGEGTVAWDVFTTAFRKVAGNSQALSGGGTVAWDLNDNFHKPVASGLYYIRLKAASGPTTITKILKVLVIR